jgi:DNA-binding transcriptional ArsR family regulator
MLAIASKPFAEQLLRPGSSHPAPERGKERTAVRIAHALRARRRPLRALSTRATLNQMVQHSPLDRTFAALADPTRRGVLERLGRGSATITELAEPFGMSLTGMKKHVRILEDAELVTTEKVGRTRRCSAGPHRLDDVAAWMAEYRRMLDERLDRLGELLERTKGAQPHE